MIRTFLLIAAAATLIPIAAHAQAPCSLLTPDQIKTILNSPVDPGQPGVAKNSNDCTWSDADGEDRVYIALQPRAAFQTTRTQIEKNGGQPTSVTGVGEDAFFVSSQQPGDTSAALYVLTKNHLLILTVNGPNATQEQNQASEKTLATQLLPQL
jgi:hypothetical protein